MKRQSTKSHLWIFLLIQSESKKCQNEMIQHSFSNVSRDLKIDWLLPTLKCDPNFTNKTFLFGHLKSIFDSIFVFLKINLYNIIPISTCTYLKKSKKLTGVCLTIEYLRYCLHVFYHIKMTYFGCKKDIFIVSLY